MQVNLDTLRELQTQEYKPRTFEPAATPYEEYLQKDFRRGNLSEIFHESTKYQPTELSRIGQSVGFFLNNESASYATAEINPDYAGRPRIDLPAPDSLDRTIESVLAARRSVGDYTGDGISKAELSTLLGHSFGITGQQKIGADEKDAPVIQQFRAYPSGGALYSVEQYVAVVNGDGDLEPGWYFYNAKEHCLRLLDCGDDSLEQQFDDIFMKGDKLHDASAVVVMTASFPRARAKYGNRGYRQILQEVGYAGQNLLLVAEAVDLGALPYDSFNDRAVESVLGIDGVDEGALTTVIIGQPTEDQQ